MFPTNIAQTIKDYGSSAIAEAMGLPISTVHTWKRRNCIPGEGALHDMKVKLFWAAVKKLKPKAERRRTPKADGHSEDRAA